MHRTRIGRLVPDKLLPVVHADRAQDPQEMNQWGATLVALPLDRGTLRLFIV